MGPRRIRRGEQAGTHWDGRNTVKLQRGQGEFAVENIPAATGRTASSCFNGATANSPWRTWIRGGIRNEGGPGFNGATANSPWRTHERLQGFVRRSRASMGPRRIRRGEQEGV